MVEEGSQGRFGRKTVFQLGFKGKWLLSTQKVGWSGRTNISSRANITYKEVGVAIK